MVKELGASVLPIRNGYEKLLPPLKKMLSLAVLRISYLKTRKSYYCSWETNLSFREEFVSKNCEIP